MATIPIIVQGVKQNIPSISDVRLAVQFGLDGTEKTGTCVVPIVSDVRDSVLVDASAGTLVVPSVNDVRDAVIFDNGTEGNLVVPSIDDVRDGIAFDSNDSLTGVLESPAVAYVLTGIGYGANGTEFIGVRADVYQTFILSPLEVIEFEPIEAIEV